MVNEGSYTVCKGEISTGFTVNTNDTVHITADPGTKVDFGSGWFIGIGAPIEGPDGPQSREIAVAPYPGVGLVKNSLIFKIGGTIYQGGVDVTITHNDPPGVLSLLPNDDRPEDNSRGWDVHVVHTAPDPAPAPSAPPGRLQITAIEVVQAIQREDNSVYLVEGHRTVVRAFVGSTDNWAVYHVTGRADFISIAPDGTQTSMFATPLNGPEITAPVKPKRENQNDSLNFEVPLMLTRYILSIEVHAWVGTTGPPEHETKRGCGVDFQKRKRLELLPLLGRDNFLTPSPPVPTMADFLESMQEAVDRLPLADPGFSTPGFKLSREREISFGHDLRVDAGWESLLRDISCLIFWFDGNAAGTRAMLVANLPNDYALNGLGCWSTFLNIPSFVAMTGLPGTFAHEFCHTLPIDHAPRGNPPPPIDPRLPASGGTEDVGFRVARNVLIPKGSSELMSYGEEPRWPSIALWRILYEHFE